VGIPTDGTLVSKWRNQAPGFVDALMPLELPKPTYREVDAKLNNQPGVEFGATHFLRAPNLSLPQPFSVALVASCDQVDVIAQALGLNSVSATRGAGFGNISAGQYSIYMGSGGNAGGTPVVDQRFLMEAHFNGVSSYLRVNGAVISTGIDVGTASVDQLVLGANWAGGTIQGGFDGHLGVVGVYSGDLDDEPDWSAARAEICTAFNIPYAAPGTPAGQTFDWSVNLNAGSSPASNGAPAGAVWTDDSGNDHHVYQENPSREPTKVSTVALLNNQPAFDFVPGSSQHYFFRKVDWLTTTFSVLTVVVLDAADYLGMIVGTHDSSVARGMGQSNTSTGRWYGALGGTGILEAGSPASGTAYVVEWIVNGSNSIIAVNGATVAGPAATGTVAPNCLFVGAGYDTGLGASRFMDGRIATLKIFAGGSHRDDAGWAAEKAALISQYGVSF
jgi:hypothetical protein